MGSAQVVEAVAVLQALHLVLEDVIEGRSQHAAKLWIGLGQATDPKVNFVQPTQAVVIRAEAIGRIDSGRAEEGKPVVVEINCRLAGQRSVAKHQFHGCVTHARQRGLPHKAGVVAVSRDEVNDRHRVFDVGCEIGPTRVGFDIHDGSGRVKLRAGFIQGRNAGVAAAGNVQGTQVKRQAQQVAANVSDDELVHGIANITRQATNQVGVDRCGVRPGADVGLRIQEDGEQGLLTLD